MVFINFKRKTNITSDELRELMSLIEHQETNEAYSATSIHINGNYATIDVDIDEFGDITLL